MNTVDFINIASAICADRPLVVFEGKRYTFSDMNERASRLANALLKMGAKKGDVIAILQVNCPQYVEIYYACAKAGFIFSPLNFRAKADEIAYMLNFSEARALLVGERYISLVSGIRAEIPTVKDCIALDGQAEGMLYYEDVLSSASSEEPVTEIGDEDVTILMFTAGTTGRPKAVPLRHDAFVAYALENVEPASPEISEVNVLTVPLYHVAGIQAMLAATYGGRTMAMMRQFEVKEWMETVQREKANRAMLVPTMLRWIVEDPDFHKYDLSSLKVITYGAASMLFEVITKAMELMPGVQFINAFGQTETASTITMLGPEDHDLSGTPEEREKKVRRLHSSIGRPMADVEVRIVDEQNKSLPLGEVGEIVARGPRVMSGYWKDKEKTARPRR
jgi:acyl-CoA synthetase (AMP-forming)/AMP-acid ligase II